MALLAKVTVELPAGNVRPAPAIITLTFKDDGTGALTDCPNAELRRRDPRGALGALALVRTAAGTYVAGSEEDPILLARAGRWLLEGRSTEPADLVQPDTEEVNVLAAGFPTNDTPTAPSATGRVRILRHTVTQAEIDAGTAVQVPCLFVPSAATALVAGGAVVSDLASCDGTHAYVLLAMSDGANGSPFQDGDVVVITALE